MREHLVSFLSCAAVAAGLLFLAGCQDKPQPPEPIPAAGPIPLNNFVRAWAIDLDLEADDGVKEIYARDTQIFAYARSGKILTLSRDLGRLRWVAQIRSTDRGGMRPPIVLKDRIVVPTSSTLEIFDPNEGTFVRSVPLKVAARSDAVGQGNLVYIGGDFEGASRFVALDVSREYVHSVWQLMIPSGGLASTPALFEDTLFLGGGNGDVYAVSAATREALWPLKDGAFKTEGPVVADLAVDESGVYVPSTDSRMYCLNKGTGRLKWQYYGGRPLTKAAVLTAEMVFLPVPDVGIAAFDKNDGAFNREPLWLAAGMTQFLAEDAKFVYLLRGADNRIVACDKQTGAARFENNRRDLVTFATNPKPDGMIFAASKTNRLLAIKPVLRPGVVGELVWNEIEATNGALAIAQ